MAKERLQEDAASEQEAALETNAVGVAVALDEARDRPELAGEVASFLREHRALIEDQRDHLREQARHLKLRFTGEFLRVVLQAMTALVGASAALMVGLLIWSATQDHSAVVESFEVPADLAARGLTGRVVAASLIDHLRDLQARSPTASSRRDYANGGEGIRVEIPQTGISFGELDRLLRERLGHETRISGGVFHTAKGLAFSARAGEAAGRTFEGPDDSLDALVQRAAEAIYAETEPYRYAIYLRGLERYDEAGAAYDEALRKGESPAWVLNGRSAISIQHGDYPRARRELRESIRFDPKFPYPYGNLMVLERAFGHDQAVFDLGMKTLSMKDVHVANQAAWSARSRAYIYDSDFAMVVGDFSGLAGLAAANRNAPTGSFEGGRSIVFQEADARALAHDPTAANDVLVDQAVADDAVIPAKLRVPARMYLPRYQILAARGDWQGAIADLKATDTVLAAAGPGWAPFQATMTAPYLAYAMARSGDLAGAAATIRATPLDCYLCVRMRAQVAELAGDRAGADWWFGQAVKMAPSVPFAEAEWGAALAARGALPAAIGKFTSSHAKGPRFADPLKGWGDALARQGQWKSAVAKYDEALRLAPAWAALREARETALRRET